MKISVKRGLSLLLSVCLMVGAVLPLAVQAEDITGGTLVSDTVIQEYKHGVFHGLTKNAQGEDLLAVPLYGRKMVIYNLDNWIVADEVYTGISNPRGATVDSEGRVWVCGDTRTLCCYDPKTRACFISKEMGLGAGSAFDITQGEDGNLYFGTYSNAKIARYNIATDSFTDLGSPIKNMAYASAVVQKGDYIYASVHGETNHYLVKLDMDGNLVHSLDISGDMSTNRYLSGLDFVDGTDILVGYCSSAAMGSIIVDAATMEKTTLGGFDKPIKGCVTESYNGKVYFATFESAKVGNKTYTNLLYSYDLQTKVAAPVIKADGSYLYGNILRGNARNMVDGIDYLEIEGKCIVTIQNQSIVTYDLTDPDDIKNAAHTQDTPVNADQGTGQSLRAITNGPAGSNEIYFGAYDTNAVWTYNTATGEKTHITNAAGSQTDSFCWYNGELYCGNYNVCSLTQIVDGNSKSLFQLNDAVFEQARIHTITAGDGKVFVGTTPDMYCYGGTIAWYDTQNGYTYVAVGPTKSEVYYAKTFDAAAYTAGKVNSGLVAQPQWYNAATNEAVTLNRKSFNGGPVAGQSINNLIYDESSGLLYGTSSVAGGTSTTMQTNLDAVLFVYDVNNMEMLATCDLSSKLSSVTANVGYVAGIAQDDSGMLWGVVSNTLFTFSYNKYSQTFYVTQKGEFGNRNSYKQDGSRQWFHRNMVFSGNYLYVSFDAMLVRYHTIEDTYEVLLASGNINNIPNQYTLSEDGDLYYILNGHLYMLNINPTTLESENAAQVNSLINALPETVTANDARQIHQAQASYEALTVQEKALVQKQTKLEDARVKLLVAQIDELEATLSLENLDQVGVLAEEYDTIALNRRSEITNYKKLAQLRDVIRQSHYSLPGGGMFAKLEDAIAAAGENGHIDLLNDTMETEVILTKGITLDLNGNTLTTPAFRAHLTGAEDWINGYVVDSSAGNSGLLKTENGEDLFRKDNPDLPLYDEQNGGYRFFDYKLQCNEGNTNMGVGKEKFWFKFHFYTDDTCTQLDADAYAIVLSGNSGLRFSTEIVWNGKQLQTVAFGKNGSTDAFCQGWADGAQEGRWLYLVVSGLRQAGDGILQLTPTVGANGVTAVNGQIEFVNNTKPGLGDYGYGEGGPGGK